MRVLTKDHFVFFKGIDIMPRSTCTRYVLVKDHFVFFNGIISGAPISGNRLSDYSIGLIFFFFLKKRVTTFGNRKRRNPWFVWTRKNLGLLFHALVTVHHTVVGGHHSSVDSRS